MSVLNKNEIIKIENLTKKFKNQVALDNLSFSVSKGQLFAFLGLNGAGKTTTINIILGLITRNGGSAYINGNSIDKNIDKIRNDIGVVFQESILDPFLSVYDNLLVRASLYKGFFKNNSIKEIVRDVIKEFQLEEIAKKPYKSLSGGQKRRVDIARALVHKPSILILDEPTTGLDPSSRKLVWQILETIQKERQLTILLTTHYMQEADNCDYAIIISKGKKIVEGKPYELKTKYASSSVKIFNPLNQIIEKAKLYSHTYKDNILKIEFNSYQNGYQFIQDNFDYIKDYELTKGSMDEVFLNVTKNLGGQNA